MSKQNNSNYTVAPGGSGLRPWAEIKLDLVKPIPKRHLSTKRKGSATLTYCSWYRTQKILDYYTNGNWDLDVEIHVGDNVTSAVARLTIHAEDRSVTRTATGCEEADVSSYGDTTSNAEAQAFKRACARFGLGLHLYFK